MFPVIPEDLSALTDEELSTLHDEAVAAFNENVDNDEVSVEDLTNVTEGIERIRSEQSTRQAAADEQASSRAALASRVNAAEGDDADGDDEGGDDDAQGGGDDTADDQNDDASGDQGDGSGDQGGDDQGAGDGADGDQGDQGGQSGGQSGDGVQASGRGRSRSRSTLGNLRRNAPARTRPRQEGASVDRITNLTASADVSGFAAGQQIGSPRELAQAMLNRQHSMGRGNSDQVTVATFHREFPDDRRLGADMSAAEIQARLEGFDTSGYESIVAAGGLCAPVVGYYDQLVLAEGGRPVRDALANFGADRGGIRLVPPPNFGDITSGQGIISAQQDAQGATKDCFVVTCDDEEETVISAIYSCLTFGNMTARTFPERVDAWNRIALAQYDRKAETFLLDRIAALSTPVTVQGYVGGAREIFARLDQLVAGYRSRHRMSPTAPLRFQLPAWVVNLISADLARTLAEPDNILEVSIERINRWFNARNVRVSWYLDSKTGGGQIMGVPNGQTYTDGVTTNADATFTSATATFTSADVGKTVTGTGIPAGTTIASRTSATEVELSAPATASGSGVTFTVGRPVATQFPDYIFGYLYAEGSLLHLDGGTLDIGLIRDSDLVSKNQFQVFNEGFENVAKVGGEVIEARFKVAPDGSYSAAKTVPNPLVA